MTVQAAKFDAGEQDVSERDTEIYITATIADQLFGLPIHQVQDVFQPESISQVPLAHAEVAGVLNLRGRIVTAIDMRRRLGSSPGGDDRPKMAVGIEHGGESYGLVIDAVGEVLQLPSAGFDRNPANLDARWAGITTGVYRLENQLMMVLDVDGVLNLHASAEEPWPAQGAVHD